MCQLHALTPRARAQHQIQTQCPKIYLHSHARVARTPRRPARHLRRSLRLRGGGPAPEAAERTLSEAIK